MSSITHHATHSLSLSGVGYDEEHAVYSSWFERLIGRAACQSAVTALVLPALPASPTNPRPRAGRPSDVFRQQVSNLNHCVQKQLKVLIRCLRSHVPCCLSLTQILREHVRRRREPERLIPAQPESRGEAGVRDGSSQGTVTAADTVM